MRILRKGKELLETFRCKLKPGGRDILDEFSINCLLYEIQSW